MVRPGRRRACHVSKRPQLYIGVSVGTGECMALAELAAHTSRAVHWHRGAKVHGNLDISPGSVIATFDLGGRHGNMNVGTSQAAICLRQTAEGI